MSTALSRGAFAATALALLTACTSHAHPPRAAHAPSPIVSGRLADIALIDRDTGERLSAYWHNGQRYVAGKPGHRYAIEVASRSGARVLAVVSVDGVNAVTGETASWEQSGYVFAPWQRWEVRGWRKSNQRVAAFEFTSLANSYAARTGRPHDVGTVGVALFREEVRPRPLPPSVSGEMGSAQRRSSREESDTSSHASDAASRSAPGAPSAQTEARVHEKLGTGHGAGEWSQVGATEFVRARVAPDEIIVIRYDSHENLVAAGVIPHSGQLGVMPQPTPFPAARSYVPDPPY